MRGRGARKYSDDTVNHLKEFVDEHPTYTLRHIQDVIGQHFSGSKVSKSLMKR